VIKRQLRRDVRPIESLLKMSKFFIILITSFFRSKFEKVDIKIVDELPECELISCSYKDNDGED
jgi:hypothetical protein